MDETPAGAKMATPKTKEDLFESAGAQLARAQELAAALEIDCEGCRLADTSLHDVRRTMGSWQAMVGVIAKRHR